MGITVDAATIDSIRISKNDKGQNKISGTYSLITKGGIILCKQDFGDGYSDVKLPVSSETTQLMSKLSQSVSNDVEISIGMKDQ